jgi:hypothetical protein
MLHFAQSSCFVPKKQQRRVDKKCCVHSGCQDLFFTVLFYEVTYEAREKQRQRLGAMVVAVRG